MNRKSAGTLGLRRPDEERRPEKAFSSVLACSECSGCSLNDCTDSFVCKDCGARIPLRGGIVDLGEDGQDTALNIEAYVAENFASAERYKAVFGDLLQAMEIAGVGRPRGRVLELGSGSGAWTMGLDELDDISHLVATDLSPGFLAALAERLSKERTTVVRCDAETLPVRHGSLDLVLGRSILHHLLDYRATLARVFRWLAPGGLAVFFEPCIEGKAWAALVLDMVLRADDELGLNSLTGEQRRRMAHARRHILKDFEIDDIDARRASLEDKYIFATEAFCTDCRAAGFEVVYAGRPGFGQAQVQQVLMAHLQQAVRDEAVARRFGFIVRSVVETVCRVPGMGVEAPMKYFVLRRPA